MKTKFYQFVSDLIGWLPYMNPTSHFYVSFYPFSLLVFLLRKKEDELLWNILVYVMKTPLFLIFSLL